jgi:hypothetical protein
MPEDQTQEQPENIEVESPQIIKGNIRSFSKAAVLNPPPKLLSRILGSAEYFITFLIGSVSGSDLFSGRQSKIINFILACCIGLCGATKLLVGVEPATKNAIKTVLVWLILYNLMAL